MRKSILFIVLLILVTGLKSEENLFEIRNSDDKKVLEIANDGLRVFNPETDLTGVQLDTLINISNKGINVFIDKSDQKGVTRSFSVVSADDLDKGSKSSDRNVFEISAQTSLNSNEVIDRPMMLWYPHQDRNAFRVGHVFIESPEEVGVNSFASGYKSNARGNYSQAMGYLCSANGNNSTAIGDGSEANGFSSFAFGFSNFANGTSSTALGNGSSANGVSSITLGRGLKARTYNEIVVGAFNAPYSDGDSTSWVQTDPLFTVGNGFTSWPSHVRKNAMVIYKNGNTEFSDNVGIGGQNDVEENHRLIVRSSTNTSGNPTPYSTALIENTYTGSNKSMALHVVGSGTDVPMLVSQKGTGDVFRCDSYLGTNTWTPVFKVTNAGKIYTRYAGLGTGTGYDLHLTDSGEIIKVSSSKRYKKDINGLEVDYNKFMSLRPVNFTWNETSATPEKKDLGLIAEEVEKVDKSLATYNEDGSIEGVDYQKVNIMLLKVVQDQQKMIDELNERLKKLEGK
ncbi:MAG: tail fiber domain-containing protein [Candidatus Delongbacteria bacterium]|nr:tail fiber domain-containing protein [Candidatus Delongbacteria bacterium]MBN2836469.1 tail fiber domain-containing protein [Candidatus Delongbacteria bacterium]